MAKQTNNHNNNLHGAPGLMILEPFWIPWFLNYPHRENNQDEANTVTNRTSLSYTTPIVVHLFGVCQPELPA